MSDASCAVQLQQFLPLVPERPEKMGREGDKQKTPVQCCLGKGRETGWRHGFFPDSGTDYPVLLC